MLVMMVQMPEYDEIFWRGDKYCAEDVAASQWKYTDGSAWHIDTKLRVNLFLDQHRHHCQHHYYRNPHNDHRGNLTVYVYIWPPWSGELSGHGGDPGVHVQRPDRLCRRRSASGLKKQQQKNKKQNKQRPDQTDSVGGDLPQVFHFFGWGGWALRWYCEQYAHLRIQLHFE